MKYAPLLFLLIFAGCGYQARFHPDQAVIVNGASGFKMDSFIVTANHVVPGPFAIVKERGAIEEICLVVKRDIVNDICLIKQGNGEYWDYSTATPNIKDRVYSIANPAGLSFSQLEGYVQNVSRYNNGQMYIQIGIDVYWGSSGSPIFNSRGNLLGVLVEAISGTQFAFVIPIQKVVLLIKQK